MFSCPGDTDVEEPSFFFDGGYAGFDGVGDGEAAVCEADQEHGVPFQAFSRVEGCEGDALHSGGVFIGVALVELVQEPNEVEVGGGFA